MTVIWQPDPEWWHKTPGAKQPRPGRLLDLARTSYDIAMRRIRTDLEQWHRELNQALREGL